MAKVRPWRGVRPRADLAGEVLAPPYDVLSEQEARDIVARLPRSFLRVTRPEVNLPAGADAHSAVAYAEARRQLEQMLADGSLVEEDAPAFYLYKQEMGEHTQVGLLALCATAEYDAGQIKKHEYTRPDKEQDRVDHILGSGAQTGLVFLAYRQTAALAGLICAPEAPPLYQITSDDGVRHTVWTVTDPDRVAAIQSAFDAVPALYIADGHHRSAAASRVAAASPGDAERGWFLAGIFPDDQLQILAYNRLVQDLGGAAPADFVERLRADFTVTPGAAPAPGEKGRIHMYLDGGWWALAPRDHLRTDDPVASLDVAILQDRVLAPLLGITDPRRDERIRFVGGIRGADALSAAVDAGRAAVAFSMYPTSLADLFAVADADQVMPPKSTWFEPKLRGGVVLHRI